MIGRIVIITLSVGHIFLCISAIPISRNNTGIEPYAGGSPLFYGTRTTLTDLGVMTMKMLETLSNSEKEDTINIEGLKDLVSVLSEGALMMDNPQGTIDKRRLESFEEPIYERLKTLEEEIKKLQMELQSNATEREIDNKIHIQKVSGNGFGESEFKGYVRTAMAVAKGTVVKMNGIMNNKAGHYNEEYGYYRCPFTGYYLLSTTLQGQSTKMGVSVIVNGYSMILLQSGECNETIRSNYGTYNVNHCGRMLSGIELVKCEVGQTIHIEATESGTLVGAANNMPQNYFSVIFTNTIMG